MFFKVHGIRLLVLLVLCVEMRCSGLAAQTHGNESLAGMSLVTKVVTQEAVTLPDDPLPQQVVGAGDGTAVVYGTVTDTSGDLVVGAQVTLERDASTVTGVKKETGVQTVSTGGDGSFRLSGVDAGLFRVTVRSKGFTDWVGSVRVLAAQTSYEVPSIVLQIPSTETDVEVVFSRHDLAQEQMKLQEKQRVLGIVPNFYVSYIWNAAPLSSGQKFHLALRTMIDPVSFLGAGVVAGVEQWQDYFSGYGRGATGYGKRFGAAYGDGLTSAMLGGAILPSLLHQDPRYFYKGTGSIPKRALYAVSTVVICRGDNGKWQPNYSNVLGDLASAGLSNLYYPASDRDGAGLTIGNALIGTASGAVASLIQEFLLHKISRGVRPLPAVHP
jgi:hypothetical protein